MIVYGDLLWHQHMPVWYTHLAQSPLALFDNSLPMYQEKLRFLRFGILRADVIASLQKKKNIFFANMNFISNHVFALLNVGQFLLLRQICLLLGERNRQANAVSA